MPAITAQQRSDLVLLVNGVFGAAPTSRVLSNLVKLVEEGNSVDQVATMLTNNSNFESIYAPALLNSEFATQFAGNLLGAAATTETTARVEALVTTYLTAGDSRTEAVWKVTKLLSTTEDAAFATAKAQLNNKADVSLTFALDTSYTELMTLEQLQSVIANVTSDEATVTAAKTAIANGEAVSGVNTGETFTLTNSIETLSGTSRNDEFTGVLDSGTATNETLNGLDILNGGAGNDTINILDAVGGDTLSGTQLNSIETVNVRSAGAVAATGLNNSFDTSSYADVTAVNVTQGTNTYLTGSATQDLTVSNVTGVVEVEGGKNVTVNVGTANQDITVGQAATAGVTNAAGTITVTDSNQGTGDIVVDGGTNVAVTATTAVTTTPLTLGDITVGGNQVATGTSAVTQNVTSDGSAVTAGDVTVSGGTTIDITANLTNTATAGKGGNITAGTYAANAGDTTTSVTITQNNTATDLAAVTTGAKAETSTVTFGALESGETVTISAGTSNGVGTDLTFTASKDLTAAEVAAAFANLTAADTQASGGTVANGVWTGDLDAGWTSGAATGATVTFTATANGNQTNEITVTARNAADNAASTNAADFTVARVDGSAGTTVAGQDVTATDGAVAVDDNATASVTTVTLDGFNGATLTDLDALTSLSLKDGAGATTLDTAQTSLALTLDGMAAGSSVNLDTSGATIATLNLTTTGSASDVDFTASVATDVNISAGANLDLSGGTFTAATDIDVTGAGNVTLGNVSTNVANLTAGTATGNISATVDGTKAVVTTGSGADSITVNTTAVSKAITLGAGNDTVTFSQATGVGVPTATIDGGEGDADVLAMTVASAAGVDGNQNFDSQVVNFERLQLTDAAATQTIDLDNLTYNYVITAGSTGAATLDNMQSGGTVELAANGNFTVNVKDASVSTNTSDVLNVIAKASTTDVNQGIITVADVETINLTSDDTNADHDSDGKEFETGERQTNTVNLNAVDATALTVDGDANLVLDVLGNTKLATIDASAMTGALTVTAAGTTASTITGGSGNDTLTASNGVASSNTGTLTFVNGTGNAAMASGDNISVTITANGATVTVNQDFDTDFATTLTALEAKVEALTGYTSSVNTGTGVLTITAENSESFTADATFTHTASNPTIGTPVVPGTDGSSATVSIAEGTTAINANDVFTLVINYDAGSETVTQAFDTDFATTMNALATKVTALDADLTASFAAGTLTVADGDNTDGDIITSLTVSFADATTTVTDTFATTSSASGVSAGDTLIGGAGNDTLTAGNLATLTGGEGNDTFVMTVPTNVNSYATITDLSSGDVIQLTAGETFVSSAVTLASTAVFQDFANAAVNQLAQNDQDAAWFQYGGDTYVVINDDQSNATNADFQNGLDAIIKVTGLVDLSTASYNQDNGTLEIA